MKWKLKVGKDEASRISKIALKVGSRVDHLIKCDVLENKYRLKKTDCIEVRNCIEGWERFKLEYPQIKVVEVDLRVCDNSSRIAGTLDLLAVNRNDGEKVLIDVKCSSFISPRYWLQTGTYASMLAVPPEMIAVLRLHKSLAFCDYQTREYEQRYRAVFNSLLAAYQFFEAEELNGETESSDNPTDAEIPEEHKLDRPEIPHDRPGRNW